MNKHTMAHLKLMLLGATLALAGCSDGEGGGDGNTANPETGTGGSTARMTISGDYLYAISGDRDVQLFDISTPSTPNPWVRISVDWGIETLFPYGDYLLIGADDGVHILDNTNPGLPEYIADLTHARARDPVVASDGYAYVTLRNQGAGANQLEVLDIREISQPTLVDTLPMQFPSGLATISNRLYVCDDIAGIKIFDTSDPANLTVAGSIPGVDCNDVLINGDVLAAITDTSVEQYDISGLEPVRLSSIGVSEE